MAFWFYRGLRRGIATTRYPKTVDPWTEGLAGPPSFHSRSLTVATADRLVAACPATALRRDERRLVVDLGRCTGCGRCIELGGSAVEPSHVFELATPERSALIKHVPIRGGDEGRDGTR